MESEGGGIADAAAADTTSQRLTSRHSTLRDSFIASDLADGLKSSTNVNNNINSTNPRPVSNVTIGTVLYGNKKSPPPNNVVVRNIVEMIRKGETLNIGGGSPSRKNSWRSFKEKLKRKKGQSQSENRNSRRRTSTMQVPQSDLLPSSTSGRGLMTNRNSLENSFRSNSLRRVDSAPADNLSLMEVDSGGSARSEGSFRLSAALATEREQTRRRLSRELDEDGIDVLDQGNGEEEDAAYFSAPENHPVRMSLIDLLEETDRQAGISGPTYRLDHVEIDGETEEKKMEEELGKGEFSCCVCMVRHKGAAFIPCGHTFCRLCSRELFVQRGNCPLCNNFILEILHIF